MTDEMLRTSDVGDVFALIQSEVLRHGGTGPVLVGISGFASGGKSYLTKELLALLTPILPGAVGTLRLDNFLGRGLGLEPGDTWEGYNWAKFEAALQALRLGLGVIIEEMDWESGLITGKTMLPPNLRVVLVEGVGLFQDRLDPYYNLGFWVECSLAECLRRGRARSRNTPKSGGGDYGDEHFDMWGKWSEKDRLYHMRWQPERRAAALGGGIFVNNQVLPNSALKPQ